MANNIKTVLLLSLLTGILLFIGSLWGQQGLTIALVMSIMVNFASYFFSDKIALRMYRAQAVTREEAPELYRVLEFLCARDGIPMPNVYIIPDESPNAFATGRNPEHASVAVTQGALRLLNESELTGVLAHEISHDLREGGGEGAPRCLVQRLVYALPNTERLDQGGHHLQALLLVTAGRVCANLILDGEGYEQSDRGGGQGEGYGG